MDNKVNAPEWNGKTIVKPEDAHDLEQRAAIYEFKHRMPREDAEHRAHHEYKKDKHKEAAAYHYYGMKAAQAVADQEEGRKHGVMYSMHMKALGLDSSGPVPNDIKSLAADQSRFYRFKPHRADAFLLDKSDMNKSELEKGDMLKFPGNSAPAVDLGQAAPVKKIPTPQIPDCDSCQKHAHVALNGPASALQNAIGPLSAAEFQKRHSHRDLSQPAQYQEAHRALTTLIHARHMFKKP